MVSALRKLLAAIGLVVVLTTITPLGYWYATLLAGPWDDPKGDVLIVLGGAVEDDGMLRSLYAVLAWREGGFRKIILSGRGICQSMQAYLVTAGVPVDVIELENDSMSTHDNAIFVANRLREVPGRKVLLTSDYHMFRAHRAFTKAGLQIEPRPIPDIRKRWSYKLRRWTLVLELCQESAKIAYYRWNGWI